MAGTRADAADRQLTAGGLRCFVGMLHLGVQAMALRYALAVACEYGLPRRSGLAGTRASDYLDVPNVDVTDFVSLEERAPLRQGHGGESAGVGKRLVARPGNGMDPIIDSPPKMT